VSGPEPATLAVQATYGDDGFTLGVRERAAWVTINRPEKKNAISLAMLEAMPGLIDDAVTTHSCTSIVFVGAGDDAFCAGFDLGALAVSDPAAIDEVITRAYDALVGSPVPTIACIDGWCIGAGLELALCCDLRTCSPASRFQLPAGKIGINYPRHGLRRIADAVGLAAARRIIILSERVPAVEAVRIGLAHELAESPEAIAAGWAKTIDESDASAVNGMRQTLRELTIDSYGG
jgi:enoyl-CoA hydratase/carnithine racemase